MLQSCSQTTALRVPQSGICQIRHAGTPHERASLMVNRVDQGTTADKPAAGAADTTILWYFGTTQVKLSRTAGRGAVGY